MRSRGTQASVRQGMLASGPACIPDERRRKNAATRYLDTQRYCPDPDLVIRTVARRGSLIFGCGNGLCRNMNSLITLWARISQGGVGHLLRGPTAIATGRFGPAVVS